MKKPKAFIKPRWNDEEAIYKWVVQDVLEDGYEDSLREWREHPGVPLSEIYTGVEREAVDAARQGNFRKLAGLVDPAHPFNDPRSPRKKIYEALGPQARELMARRLAGRGKGKRAGKAGRGRPRNTEEERRADNPIHDAADTYEQIKHFLNCEYPDEDIEPRSIEFAARYHGVEAGTLVNHLRRSQNDSKHRIPRPRS